MPILLIEDLNYSYISKSQRTDAIRDANYVFESGQVYVIMGKSGSGKTTLLSLLAGLDKPLSGQILLDGEGLESMDISRYRRDKVAMIYQQFNLLPLLSVQENVMYPMVLSGVSKPEAQQRSVERLRELGLGELFDRRLPHTRSGGEQQRVAIARALCMPARVILADEPTGSLDSENSKIIMGILKDLAHEKGYLVIIVTHDPAVAEHGDTCLRMDAGRFPVLTKTNHWNNQINS